MTSAPFYSTNGPRNARIAIVGEAWGDQEEMTKLPFMGSSGQELTRMLAEAKISRSECFLTSVFNFKPPQGDIEKICVNKKEAGIGYPMPPYGMGKYIKPELLGEVARLQQELQIVKPNLTLALGNTACWALLNSSGIGSLRGTVAYSTLVDDLKVLPTYNPAAVMRNWALRVIVITDLMKAERERHFPEIRRPEREILINPSFEEMLEWWQENSSALYLGVDIETRLGQITCIGFASSPTKAMVIPFVDYSGKSYWPTPDLELDAWNFVETLLSSPIPKVFQNGLYDLQYILQMGLKIQNCTEDTMLLHHALYPELQKGLGFLGSIYTNESSWKNTYRKTTLKKDE